MTATNWAEAAAGRVDGMAAADAHAPTGWSKAAFQFVSSYSEMHEFFHVDEFWTWATAYGLSTPPNQKAIGPVIARAARKGVLEHTNVSAQSVRSHLSPKPVWRCRAYAGTKTGRFRDITVV